MKSVYQAKSIADFKEAAKYIIQLMDEYRIFLLTGNLGAGKTTFVQQICDLMITKDIVTSPTFALINPYLTEKGKVFHMDMYRVNSPEEAIDFGIEEYFWDEENYCFVEWPEMIEVILPDKYVKIHIEQMEDQSRKISISSSDNNT